MTHETKNAIETELTRLGILCDDSNPSGVVVRQAEDDDGRQIVGYIRLADDHEHATVKESTILPALRNCDDAEDFWAMLIDLED